MPNSGKTDISELVTSADTAQGYWQLGILWTPLISTEQAKGQYSLMEQLMPASAGPPPHTHEHSDEAFYILDGEMMLQIGEQTVVGRAGQLIRVPAGTTHAFVVRSETARVLNFYAPADLDLQVSMLATPASAAVLPAADAEHPPTPEQQRAFTERLHELATQRMDSSPNLLAEYRGAHTQDRMP
ncbi:cupin domain-containing protein [Streptomyces sp. NBC_01012]|uniref:cupin domain-containing protein n=1 Tax=Streptomyces sp. NBC_01012 TaxID=2903717 RepID=UPI003868477A|nr:cupin domain-containing protein [Streptomyces sp. NBC_01012]